MSAITTARPTIPGALFRKFVATGVCLATVLLQTAPALFAQEAPKRTKAVVIPIKGEISDVLSRSIERRLEQARADGVDTVIFEMDTPGGLVTSALDISKMIKRLQDEGVYTVAWVNDQAYSAGALISVAAQEIIMTSTASMGDCAPIMITPTGGLEELGQAERAKAESPILQEFRDSAKLNGYDPLLCRAMVTVGVEVWWLENIETGEREFVQKDEKIKRIDDVGEDEEAKWKLVETYDDPRTGREVKISQPVDREDQLLTVSPDEAIAFGLATAVTRNLGEVASHLGIEAVLTRLEISGWEKFAMWLNSPLVRGIIFVIMLIGAYIEFQSPGLILPGSVALIALAIFLGAPYAAGLANIWTIVVLVVGLGLLAVEVFVLPGFGIAGILGVLLVLASFVGTFVPAEPNMPPFAWPSMQGTWDAIKQGLIVLASSVIIAVFGIALLARYLPSMPFGRGLVLASPPGTTADEMAIRDANADLALPGDIGVVTGDLRPGGQARFGHAIVDVTSQGEYVDAGRRVQVLHHDGPKIVVRQLPDDAGA